MRLIVARHCRSVWNEEGRMQGQQNIGLSPRGVTQAVSILAWSLKDAGVTRIVASDLARAAETAHIVQKMNGGIVELDERLREISYGWLEGCTLSECERLTAPHNHEDSYDIMGFDYRPYGGESAQQAYARQRAALDDIKARYEDETVLVIGHGHSLRTVLYGSGHGIFVPKQGDYRIIDF